MLIATLTNKNGKLLCFFRHIFCAHIIAYTQYWDVANNSCFNGACNGGGVKWSILRYRAMITSARGRIVTLIACELAQLRVKWQVYNFVKFSLAAAVHIQFATQINVQIANQERDTKSLTHTIEFLSRCLSCANEACDMRSRFNGLITSDDYKWSNQFSLHNQVVEWASDEEKKTQIFSNNWIINETPRVMSEFEWILWNKMAWTSMILHVHLQFTYLTRLLSLSKLCLFNERAHKFIFKVTGDIFINSMNMCV